MKHYRIEAASYYARQDMDILANEIMVMQGIENLKFAQDN